MLVPPGGVELDLASLSGLPPVPASQERDRDGEEGGSPMAGDATTKRSGEMPDEMPCDGVGWGEAGRQGCALAVHRWVHG